MPLETALTATGQWIPGGAGFDSRHSDGSIGDGWDVHGSGEGDVVGADDGRNAHGLQGVSEHGGRLWGGDSDWDFQYLDLRRLCFGHQHLLVLGESLQCRWRGPLQQRGQWIPGGASFDSRHPDGSIGDGWDVHGSGEGDVVGAHDGRNADGLQGVSEHGGRLWNGGFRLGPPIPWFTMIIPRTPTLTGIG